MADRAKLSFLQQLAWRVLTTKQLEKALILHITSMLEREEKSEKVTFCGEDAMECADDFMEELSESVCNALYDRFERTYEQRRAKNGGGE